MIRRCCCLALLAHDKARVIGCQGAILWYGIAAALGKGIIMDTQGKDPDGKQKRPNNEESISQEKDSKPIPAVIKPSAPASVGAQRDAYDEKNYRLSKKQYRVAITTLVVLGIYTAIAAYQACQMRVSTRVSAKAAKTASDTLHIAYRPWVSILGITQGQELEQGRIRVSFIAPNFGPVPAKNVRFFAFDNIGSRSAAYKLHYGPELDAIQR